MYCSVGPAKNLHFDTTKTSGTLSLARIHLCQSANTFYLAGLLSICKNIFLIFMQQKTVVLSVALITYHANLIIANKKTPVLMQISEKHYPDSGLFPLPGMFVFYIGESTIFGSSNSQS